jgi:uncharacterized protein with FMN-binding domain
VASQRFRKTAAICGVGAVASLLPLGVNASNAATVKTTVKKSGTFLGASAMTRYGAVQVSVTVKNGKITKVAAPVYPVESFRDQQINAQAIPMLEQEVIAAQSSNINNITGASFTSQGFYTSLVSALAKAGLK